MVVVLPQKNFRFCHVLHKGLAKPFHLSSRFTVPPRRILHTEYEKHTHCLPPVHQRQSPGQLQVEMLRRQWRFDMSFIQPHMDAIPLIPHSAASPGSMQIGQSPNSQAHISGLHTSAKCQSRYAGNMQATDDACRVQNGKVGSE